jgi:hypothetical protein
MTGLVRKKKKSLIYTPQSKNTNFEGCFLICLYQRLKLLNTSFEEFSEKIYNNFNIPYGSTLSIKWIIEIAKLYDIHLIIYKSQKINISKNWKNFKKEFDNKDAYKLFKGTIWQKTTYGINKCSYNQTLSESQIELKLLEVNNHYDTILDDTYFKNKVYCRNCHHWIELSQDLAHFKICAICSKCDRSITVGSEHERFCTGKQVNFTNVLKQNQSTYNKKKEQGLKLFKSFAATKDANKKYPKQIKYYKMSPKDVSWKNNIHFADFETFYRIFDVARNYKVYATAIVSVIEPKYNNEGEEIPNVVRRVKVKSYERKEGAKSQPQKLVGTRSWADRTFYTGYQIQIHKNAMKEFMDHLRYLKGIIFFWNGSAFDLFFVLRYMLKYKWDIDHKELIINNNRIISMRIHKNLVARDLMLYLAPCSLRSACKSFGVPDEYSKGDFDHSLINDWKDLHDKKKVNEVNKYIKNDVVSMAIIYENYAESLYKSYNVNLTSAITLSHMAYMIWSDTIKSELPEVRIYNIEVDLYQKIIPGYFGGRVLLTTPKRVSVDYTRITNYAYSNNGFITQDLFESIRDYDVKLDVVSLYPSVMAKYKYPVGNYKFVDTADNLSFQTTIKARLESLHACSWHERVFLCVDLISPTDIYIPFLMSRGPKGELVQDLNPKFKQVYYGCELAHAITKLGYRITKVHWLVEFEDAKPIFGSYMKTFWERKKAAKKGTAEYESAKATGNALSGKFGQKLNETTTRIRSVEEKEKFNFIGVEAICEDDEILGYITVEPTQVTHTTYPCYIAIAILAYSRIHMSEYTIMIDGYKNPQHVPLYGDTDSIIIRKSAYDLIKDKLGKEMGMMADEFDGGKCLTFIGLALKTYNQVYVSKNLEVLDVTRCKGIPHRSEPRNIATLKYTDSWILKTKLSKVLDFIENPDIGEEIPIKGLGVDDIIYHYKTKGLFNERGKVVMHLGFEVFDNLLQKEATVTAYYGGIKKTLKKNSIHEAITVRRVLNGRSIAITDWWGSEKRRKKVDKYEDISQPIGFISIEESDWEALDYFTENYL